MIAGSSSPLVTSLPWELTMRCPPFRGRPTPRGGTADRTQSGGEVGAPPWHSCPPEAAVLSDHGHPPRLPAGSQSPRPKVHGIGAGSCVAGGHHVYSHPRGAAFPPPPPR